MKRLSGAPWAVLATACLGLFIAMLDTTIVSIAAPTLIDALRASLDQVLWMFNAYILALTILLIPGGRLGDLYSPRTIFIVGLGVFTAASILCGIAASPGQLIAARVLQGAGGALLSPQSLALVVTVFPPERLGAAFGVYSAVVGIAGVAGPTLGGVLVDWLSWRWVFFVNVPIGATAITFALFIIPGHISGPRPRIRRGFDILGVLLLSVALFCITYGMIEGERYDWGQIWSFVSIPVLLGTGTLLLLVFPSTQHKSWALAPSRLFSRRNYILMNLVAAAVAFALFGIYLPLTIYLQSVLQLDALSAAFVIAAMPVTSMISSLIAGQVTDRMGGKFVLIVGITLFAVGIGYIAFVARADTDGWALQPGLIASGFGTGLAFTPMTALAMRAIPLDLSGAASGVFSATRQLGNVIGGAAVGTLLQSRLAQAMVKDAYERSGVLAPNLRGLFIDMFRVAGRQGLQVGTGQVGTKVPASASIPLPALRQLHQSATEVFTRSFVTALRPALLLAAMMLVVAVLAAVAVREREPCADRSHGQPESRSQSGRDAGAN